MHPEARGASARTRACELTCASRCVLAQAWPDAGAAPRAGTTVPGEVRRLPGGVARNIAAVLAALPSDAADAHAPPPPPLLISAVGDDADGGALLAHLRRAPRSMRPCRAA